MALSQAAPPGEHVRPDWVAVAGDLGPRFADRAAVHDADDTFVAASYAELRERKVFSAGVPAELGGGGASHAELCEMLRTLAQYCSSTALALAMHTHQVAIPAWRWRHAEPAVEPLLRRIAAEELILVTSGGSDWLVGSGRADKVEGGYRVSGRKVFASGSPAADLFMTMAVHEDPVAGPTVLHFAIPFKDSGVKVQDNWRTLGMRGTGSNDVVLDGVFVPETAIGLRRPAGRWSPPWHVVVMVALPLINSVYVGVAEAAATLALREARARKRHDDATQEAVGIMQTELATARMALRHMVAAAAGPVSEETTNEILMGRTLVTEAAIRTVEAAMAVAAGAGFFRGLGLERLFRDVQAARYHPLRAHAQRRYTGRLALGLDVND
jgi:alkylation response protein AidB-like acyl-CoA dehydrogenase